MSPTTLNAEEPIDPVALNARLVELRAQYTIKKVFTPPASATEEELSELRKAHDTYVADLIREQIDIIMRLRRTASGPAKKGGKRAKAAPVDLTVLFSD